MGITLGMGTAIAGLAGALGQGGQAVATGKMNKKNRAWSEAMYREQRDDNRINAETAFQRSIDFKAQMQAYKDAGINPYAVAGNQTSAPQASSSSASTPHTETPNIGAIGNAIGAIPQTILQQKLINAQKTNIEANTANTEANTEGKIIDNMYAPMRNALGNEQTAATIANIKETSNNLRASNENIQQLTANAKTAQIGMELANITASLEQSFLSTRRQLEQEQLTIQNSKSKQEIQNLRALLQNYQTATKLIETQIALNAQALQNGTLTPELMRANINNILAQNGLTTEKTLTERKSRDANIRSTNRSNQGILAPVEGVLQKINRALQPPN